MPTAFKKTLFWDVSEVDDHKNGRFVIERILNFGNENDFNKALEVYGKEEIASVVRESRNLDRKSQSFWCQYFNLDQKQCLRNQSAREQGLFWKR
jgi:hypothetical protein